MFPVERFAGRFAWRRRFGGSFRVGRGAVLLGFLGCLFDKLMTYNLLTARLSCLFHGPLAVPAREGGL